MMLLTMMSSRAHPNLSSEAQNNSVCQWKKTYKKLFLCLILIPLLSPWN